MILFELSLDNWKRRWTGDAVKYYRIFKECEIPKELLNRNFYYHWSDGWDACISVRKVDAREARKLMKVSAGFCGYDWMIDSIIRHGKILTSREEKELLATIDK